MCVQPVVVALRSRLHVACMFIIWEAGIVRMSRMRRAQIATVCVSDVVGPIIPSSYLMRVDEDDAFLILHRNRPSRPASNGSGCKCNRRSDTCSWRTLKRATGWRSLLFNRPCPINHPSFCPPRGKEVVVLWSQCVLTCVII